MGELVVQAQQSESELDSRAEWLQKCVEKLRAGDQELVRKLYSPQATGDAWRPSPDARCNRFTTPSPAFASSCSTA